MEDCRASVRMHGRIVVKGCQSVAGLGPCEPTSTRVVQVDRKVHAITRNGWRPDPVAQSVARRVHAASRNYASIAIPA